MTSDAPNETAIEYATFWRRLGASLIDGLILWQLTAPLSFGWPMSPAESLAAYAVIRVLYGAYTPFMHGRWGRTIGKRVTGIELRTLGGGNVGWRHALWRSSVDIVLELVSLGMVVHAWRSGVRLPDGLDPAKVGSALVTDEGVFDTIAATWYVAELITMLANKERRALHDFLGGTIVIRINETRAAATNRT